MACIVSFSVVSHCLTWHFKCWNVPRQEENVRYAFIFTMAHISFNDAIKWCFLILDLMILCNAGKCSVATQCFFFIPWCLLISSWNDFFIEFYRESWQKNWIAEKSKSNMTTMTSIMEQNCHAKANQYLKLHVFNWNAHKIITHWVH